MTTQTAQPPNAGSAVTPYRLTVRQFLKAAEAGVFPHEARIELLGGIPVEKMTRYPPHNSTVYRLGMALRALLPADWIVLEEKPVVLGRFWRPEPDLAAIRGPIDRHVLHDPKAADVTLVIEVAESTYPKDRGLKWRRYAAVGLPTYWIVNLESARVELYTDPTGRGKTAHYRTTNVFKKGDTVPVVVDGREVGRIAVNDFMP